MTSACNWTGNGWGRWGGRVYLTEHEERSGEVGGMEQIVDCSDLESGVRIKFSFDFMKF